MDLIDHLVEHDLWLTERILACAEALPDGALDDPIAAWSEGLEVVAEPTLRGLLEAMVFTKEMWGAGMTGEAIPGPHSSTVGEMLERWRVAGSRFRRVVEDVRRHDRWNETFIRTTWTPPELFTMGGAVAHTLTFSACRRTLALRVLQARGLGRDLEDGDPILWAAGQSMKGAGLDG